MRKMLYASLVVCCLTLSACPPPPSSEGPALSPRENAENVATHVYAPALVAVELTLKSGFVPETTKEQVKTGSQIATNAFIAYYDAAGYCLRDEKTKVVGDSPANPPGKHCDQTLIGKLLPAALSAISDVVKITTQAGYAPVPVK